MAPRGPARRRGRVPIWLVIALATTAAVAVGEALGRWVRAAGFETVDPRRARLDPGAGWCDPRWEAALAERIAAFGPVPTRDVEGLAALASEVARLPFVAEVGEPRVRWPDGVELDLRLRRPVACVVRGVQYLPVAEDGMLLPGAWSGPPPVGEGWLPVLGPIDDAFRGARPGDRLAEPRHLAALAVALSMERHLDAAERARLGPVVIDASRADRASVAEPGVRLYLEQRRLVRFGRGPGTDAPGELPVEAKWASVRAGLAQLASGDPERDWDLLDVRWDRPEIRRRRP